MTKQEKVDAAWTAMTAAPREDRDALRAAYVAALQAMDATDDTPEAIADQKRRDREDYEARQAAATERAELSHKRFMGDDPDWTAEMDAYEAATAAERAAMDTEPSDL